ncbi:MAG: hypothetical protein HY082_06235 [Gammaproteobacteria bacterium]|nr:hypothetical protein [Gammaproteobacteria bacterium]
MRLTLYIGIAMVAVGLDAYAADPLAAEPSPETRSAPLHSRPFTVKCAATVRVWVEMDDSSLPAREGAKAESKKRVQLKLVGSASSRGESVVCSYASRSRDVTTSYYVRCIQPRKERGQRHTYACRR